MLEKGRALLWSRMKGYRQPVLELRTVDHALADRFETVSDQLEKLATSQSRLAPDALEPAPRFGAARDKKLKQQRVLSAEWDDIVKHIRQIEGFSDFLQPVPFERLKHAAAEGPVIVVNVSSYRSDALIIRDIASGPTLVPLADSLYDEVGEFSDQLDQARESSALALLTIVEFVLRSVFMCVSRARGPSAVPTSVSRIKKAALRTVDSTSRTNTPRPTETRQIITREPTCHCFNK
ncbi:hypothetical protein HETIRDRAFT_314147 [Heterobasidion irregulare TC 32-1]|uniref:Uncharacterized protein n=1 Tax=Heterobasidion irregulare (strain TC 32-1) TaxID=747525 RepID=W4KGR2_HETIT|nr:uncharacterized protein HETIRDRAFT_314147 [Heterobasidion irregulare TC 32-1]ETW84899.1 hypothetical protein HETIRDRAFT_314147 [Heterobasidion irregulare TC 32-1]